MVAYFSTHMQLLPGDLIATGTPPGVGFGKNRYMTVGDVLECGIANLGAQRHDIKPQPSSHPRPRGLWVQRLGNRRAVLFYRTLGFVAALSSGRRGSPISAG
jgi:hypothetical protein